MKATIMTSFTNDLVKEFEGVQIFTSPGIVTMDASKVEKYIKSLADMGEEHIFDAKSSYLQMTAKRVLEIHDFEACISATYDNLCLIGIYYHNGRSPLSGTSLDAW